MNYEPLYTRIESTQLIKTHLGINCIVKASRFEQSIVTFLSDFGNLYIGNLIPDTFKNIFEKEKSRYIDRLLTINNSVNFLEALQPEGFKAMLTRESMIRPWRWPALVNQTLVDGALDYTFYTGLGRLLATGLTKTDPWEHLKILMFVNKTTHPTDFLQEPLQIHSDADLCNALNIDYINNSHAQLDLEIHQDGYGPSGFVLKTMYDGNTDFNYHAGDQNLINIKNWYCRYGPRPKLQVYTDWPELLTKSKLWDVVVAGKSKYIHNKFHLGHLEYSLREINNNSPYNSDHVLYITKGISIDVDELISWVDLENTVYADQDLRFILFRHSDPFKLTRIVSSYI